MGDTAGAIELPSPKRDGQVSLERALAERRSIRAFAHRPLTLAEIAQLLWAAQGITDPSGLRTAPSAGALYPLELYLVVGEVVSLAPGIYHYRAGAHALEMVGDRDQRAELGAAALDQTWIAAAAAVLVIAAVSARTMAKYGVRGQRYVHIEVGHAAQNVYLQAVAIGLGTTEVGAFDDARVTTLLGLPAGTEPLALLPLGRPR